MSRSFAITLRYLLLALCWFGLLLALPGIGVMRFADHVSKWIDV